MTQEIKNMKEQVFYVSNMDCENEAAKITRELKKSPGVHDVKAFPGSSKVVITFDQEIASSQSLQSALTAIGFPVRTTTETNTMSFWRNKKVLYAMVSGVALAAGWVASKLGVPSVFSLVLYLTSIVIGGHYFAREALEEIVHERRIGIELLMTVAAVIALLLGESLEAATLVFLYSISEAAEGYTEEKTRAAVRALMKLVPKVALVVRDGAEMEVPVEELKIGDIFVVRPGEAVATDGEVVSGASSVNEAPVTGESMPIKKQPGSSVFAGSINAEGGLEVRVTKTFSENTIARIIQMVEEAQERKGKNQRFIEKFGSIYSPLVLLFGILVAILPPIIFAAPWITWVNRATVFIVAAAPCALVISIPITLVATLGTAARKGLLIKGGVYLEELARVTVVSFDKTGTITMGSPEVTDFAVMPGIQKNTEELLAIAYGIESRSQHPLAEAVVRYAKERNIQPKATSNFQSISGFGATAVCNGTNVKVGSPSFFENALQDSALSSHIEQWQSEGKTVILLGEDKIVWAMFGIRDQIRPKAAAVVTDLKNTGIRHIIMLTGDNQRTAMAIAKDAGINEVFADLKPEDKAVKIRELVERYPGVLMVGDGVNDAPALAEATVGVAMGAAGTDVALEKADVALMADDLQKLVYAIKLAQRNKRVINQNLFLSTLVISALVIGALMGWFSLPIAVLGHEISELIVIASGLRMMRA